MHCAIVAGSGIEKMVPPIRFERTTFPLGGGRSIQLSYGGIAITLHERRQGMPNGMLEI